MYRVSIGHHLKCSVDCQVFLHTDNSTLDDVVPLVISAIVDYIVNSLLVAMLVQLRKCQDFLHFLLTLF